MDMDNLTRKKSKTKECDFTTNFDDFDFLKYISNEFTLLMKESFLKNSNSIKISFTSFCLCI